jgi:hypothetical protein
MTVLLESRFTIPATTLATARNWKGAAISFLDPFMPNDVRGYGSVWSEKEKIGVLQAQAWRSCCERLSGLLHVMARRREGKRVWPSERWEETKVGFGVD